MKKILLTATIVAALFSAKAQSKDGDESLKFNAGIELGLPVGDLKSISSFGFGASVMGEYPVEESLGITLSAGFLSFSGKTYNTIIGVNPVTFQPIYGDVKASSTSIIPVLAGAKYHFTEKVYGHLQAGLSFFNNGLGSAFTYAPTIGVMASENIDISLKYQGASKNGGSLSFIGLRAAYSF